MELSSYFKAEVGTSGSNSTLNIRLVGFGHGVGNIGPWELVLAIADDCGNFTSS